MPPSEPAAVVVFVLQLTTHIVALTFTEAPRHTYQYHRLIVPNLCSDSLIHQTARQCLAKILRRHKSPQHISFELQVIVELIIYRNDLFSSLSREAPFTLIEVKRYWYANIHFPICELTAKFIGKYKFDRLPTILLLIFWYIN